MSTPSPINLTVGQRAMLEAALVQRQHELDRRLQAHHRGDSRAEHAHEVLEQDGDDAPQRAGERELDMALSDMELREIGNVSRALQRLHTPAYGRCVGCGDSIAFDRLVAEPWAERCIACESAREQRSGA